MKIDPSLCHCGNSLYWDASTSQFLCPSRFDGTHTKEKEQEYLKKLNEKQESARSRGSAGGLKRAQTLSAEERSAIASKAAQTRWSSSRARTKDKEI